MISFYEFGCFRKDLSFLLALLILPNNSIRSDKKGWTGQVQETNKNLKSIYFFILVNHEKSGYAFKCKQLPTHMLNKYFSDRVKHWIFNRNRKSDCFFLKFDYWEQIFSNKYNRMKIKLRFVFVPRVFICQNMNDYISSFTMIWILKSILNF